MNLPQTRRPLLIVDDEEDAHRILKRALSRIGVKAPTESVNGGEAAVAYFNKCLAGEAVFPALVFLDVKMPDMNGFKVLSWMREKSLLGMFSLVMLTASDNPHDVNQAMSLGAHCYLTKPPAPDVLRDVVGSAIILASLSATPVTSGRPAAAAKPVRVLAVDDSPFARRMTRHLLETMGYEVEEAASGPQAIARCLTQPPPDLVFLDLVMGEMDGFAVITLLRNRKANVRIVVVSADTRESTRDAAIRAGALGYIVKPLSPQKIAAAAAAALVSP